VGIDRFALQGELQAELLICRTATARLSRNRLYAGQGHTLNGERGHMPIAGLTVRDLCDCAELALLETLGGDPADWPSDTVDLPVGGLDPQAFRSSLMCWIERYLGIFPNLDVKIPDSLKLRFEDEVQDLVSSWWTGKDIEEGEETGAE